MVLEAGHRIGPYEVVAPVGAGGMGEVYRARDTRLDREIAVKVLPEAAGADKVARERLVREARTASKLNHPHICTIHDVGEDDGRIYFAMELVSGRTLADLMTRGPLPLEEVLLYGSQVADALAHAHAHGIVHRDLKSANIVITPEGRAKVLDFGLAKRLPGEIEAEATTLTDDALTAAGAVAGTPAYMAPEQLQGKHADARSDIWSLGIVLYELAAGKRPFSGQTGYQLSAAILNDPPPPLPPSVPGALGAVIERCLAKDPGRRYQGVAELRAALEAIREGQSPSFGAWRYRLSRNRRLAGGVVAAGILVATLVTFMVLRESRLQTAVGAAGVRSLAVLPLENLSGDPEQDYLAAGIQESLITDLAKLSGLTRVIARPSVMRFRNSGLPLSQIAKELGVDALVTGSVLRAGDRIQVTAHLIQASTENQLWADRYERQFRDVLSLGNEVVAAITDAIQLQLTPQEQRIIGTPRPVDPEAYEAYARGMHLLYTKKEENFAKGLALLEQAIDEDPTDPLPWAGLALAYPIIYHGPGGNIPPSEGFPRARDAALEALRLDESSARAHLALAAIKMYHDWDWEGAEREFQRAIELNPNLVEAHGHYAWFLHLFDRNEEARVEARTAQQLDPLAPFWTSMVAWLHLNLDELEMAKLEAEKALEMDPDQPDALFVLAMVHAAQGAVDESITVGRRLAAINPDWRFGLAWAYAIAGRRQEALEMAADMERENYPKFGLFIYHVHVLLGNQDEALRAMEAAFEYRHIFIPWSIREFPWKDDPRWQEMKSRLHFPEG
jgi:TolB-like protein/tetratricopeptide (TPR) repeat protein